MYYSSYTLKEPILAKLWSDVKREKERQNETHYLLNLRALYGAMSDEKERKKGMTVVFFVVDGATLVGWLT